MLLNILFKHVNLKFSKLGDFRFSLKKNKEIRPKMGKSWSFNKMYKYSVSINYSCLSTLIIPNYRPNSRDDGFISIITAPSRITIETDFSSLLILLNSGLYLRVACIYYLSSTLWLVFEDNMYLRAASNEENKITVFQ